MRASLHRLKQAWTMGVGVDRFMLQSGPDALEELFQLAWRARDDQQKLGGDGLEHCSPALRRQPLGQLGQGAPDEREQASADDEREDRRVQERFDDLALAARHLIHPIVMLQLPEEQLDLPAEGMGRADVLGRELLDRDVRDVEVMPFRPLVPDSDDAQLLDRTANAPAVGASLKLHCNLDVENLTYPFADTTP